MKRFIKNRLKEGTSWGGLASMAISGALLSPEPYSKTALAIAGAVFGLVAFATKEKSSNDFEQ